MKKTSLTISSRAARCCLSLMTAGVFTLGIAQGLSAELLGGIAENGRLVLFSSDDPEDAEVVQVRGLRRGETILGIDVRPATGQLYALGSSARIYTLDPLSGHATAIGTGPFTDGLSGTSFGFDFNPTVDRIRVVSNTGLNLRLHPDTGAIAATDTSLAYAVSDPGAGLTPSIVAAAYSNNDTNPATGTTLYNIDSAQDVLTTQIPPNNGTLNTVGRLGVNTVGVVGFDISGVDGVAYAALVPAGQPGNSARASLYTINLATGAATLVGKIGGPKPLTSLTALGAAR